MFLMISSILKKITSVFVVLAVSLSLGLISPASASTSVHTTSAAAPSSVANLEVVQLGGRGSFFGQLRWNQVESATQYRIYKTGTIRPQWRLFAYVSPAASRWTVSDKPGVVAVYRVMALVKNREVLVGQVYYFPAR
jgi:hypothetical protein